MSYGRKSMSYNDTCFSFLESFERFLYESLSSVIESRSGFIEDKYFWIFKKKTSDRNTLFFSSREFEATLSDNRFYSLRKFKNKMCFCFPQSLFYIFFTGFGICEFEIFFDREIKKTVILRNDSYMVSKGGFLIFLDIDSIQKYLS